MSSPDFELIGAVLAALKANAAVAGFVEARIYDRAPEDRKGEPKGRFPYITMGPSSSIPADFDCRDGEEVTIQVDVWSQGNGEAYGSAECRKISGAVRSVLHDAELTLNETAFVCISHEITRTVRDPDGVTHHAAMQFTAVIETP